MRLAKVIAFSLVGMVLSSQAFAQQAPAPFKDEYADVNGVRLHYASVGDSGKPLVLFLHGYPMFWYSWKDQMLDLGRDHFAVAPDMRGYNLSDKPAGVENYKMKLLIEDVRQLAEKLGKGKKITLVIHDWGALVGWTFAMFYPEMIDKLIVVNGAHPFVSEREMNENPGQRYASNYHFIDNGFLAPGEKPINEVDTKQSGEARARVGFVQDEIRNGHFTEADRQMYADAWSQPGSTTGGLNYYRANHRNPPFNDTHPKSMVPTHWSPKEFTAGATSTIVHVPTLVIWGLQDGALPPGNISGLDKWVPDVRYKLYPDDGHNVMITKYKEVSADMRAFIEGKDIPREEVYRKPAAN